MCVGLALFAAPTLRVLYFAKPEYVAGASALAILAIGMTFYSIFSISTSIIQGIGNPRIPMYILIFGSITTGLLCWLFVPGMGIAGGALGTTIGCLAMMIPVVYFVFKLTKAKFQILPLIKITMASLIMGVFALLIPKNATWLFPGIFLCIIVYFFALILVRFFTKEDIESLRKLSLKTGRLSSISNKLLDFVERIEFRNK